MDARTGRFLMKPKPLTIEEVEARHVYDSCGLTIETNAFKRTPLEKKLVTTWGGGLRGEWSAEAGLCKVCACEIDASPTVLQFGGSEIAMPSTVCPSCMVMVRESYDPYRDTRQEADATATPKWDANCPARHKQVVLGEVKPDRIDWSAYNRAIQWTPSDGRGLILMGAPGTGKTSAFWAISRALEAGGHSPITLGSLELGRALAEAAKDIREVGWLYRCRVLMVDDLGKERASPGVAALLWEVLDRRLSANLPCIFTTNFDGPGLAARFSEAHLGDAVRRRISELCRRAQFGAVVEQAA